MSSYEVTIARCSTIMRISTTAAASMVLRIIPITIVSRMIAFPYLAIEIVNPSLRISIHKGVSLHPRIIGSGSFSRIAIGLSLF